MCTGVNISERKSVRKQMKKQMKTQEKRKRIPARDEMQTKATSSIIFHSQSVQLVL